MNIINVVSGYVGSAEITLHHIFTSSTLFFFNSGKLRPGKVEKYNWASEASPTLGCSIEISRDIYMSVGMSVVS